jgi:hypothetical protein
MIAEFRGAAAPGDARNRSTCQSSPHAVRHNAWMLMKSILSFQSPGASDTFYALPILDAQDLSSIETRQALSWPMRGKDSRTPPCEP